MSQLILLLCGVLGVLAHCLIKANSLQTDATKANMDFKFTDYIKKDYLGIALSFVSVIIWLLLFEEVALKYPGISNFVRASFVAMGLVGSYLIQTMLSKAKQQIRSKVDKATDELDDIKSGK